MANRSLIWMNPILNSLHLHHTLCRETKAQRTTYKMLIEGSTPQRRGNQCRDRPMPISTAQRFIVPSPRDPTKSIGPAETHSVDALFGSSSALRCWQHSPGSKFEGGWFVTISLKDPSAPYLTGLPMAPAATVARRTERFDDLGGTRAPVNLAFNDSRLIGTFIQGGFFGVSR